VKKPSEIIDLIREEEKGEESDVPIINENPNANENSTSPSKEQNEET